MARTTAPRSASAPAAAPAPEGVAAPEVPYTQARFMLTGRRSATLNVTNPDGSTTLKHVSYVSLVPVDDEGNPINDLIPGMGPTSPNASFNSQFEARIPNIAVVDGIPDGQLVGFQLL